MSIKAQNPICNQVLNLMLDKLISTISELKHSTKTKINELKTGKEGYSYLRDRYESLNLK